MEVKPVFTLQKALLQPVRMCMLDMPLSLQDQEVSKHWALQLVSCLMGHHCMGKAGFKVTGIKKAYGCHFWQLDSVVYSQIPTGVRSRFVARRDTDD